VRQSFYRAHDLKGFRIADPFMEGGTPLLEANRLGAKRAFSPPSPEKYGETGRFRRSRIFPASLSKIQLTEKIALFF